jgi:hypothetical protein
MLLRAGRFGDLRRKILSWWRSARLSISSEARDRNNPISPHQISLHSAIIEQKLHPIRCCSPVVLGLRQGQVARTKCRHQSVITIRAHVNSVMMIAATRQAPHRERAHAIGAHVAEGHSERVQDYKHRPE